MPFLQCSTGDIVMVCRHIYELSSCKVVQNLDVVERELQRGGSVSDRGEFKMTRDDGSKFIASHLVTCSACSKANPKSIDFIEQHWHDGGALRVADFMRGHRDGT